MFPYKEAPPPPSPFLLALLRQPPPPPPPPPLRYHAPTPPPPPPPPPLPGPTPEELPAATPADDDAGAGGAEGVRRSPVGAGAGVRAGDVALPAAAAAASLVVVLSLLAALLLLLRRRRKLQGLDAAGPSIVVYPSARGAAPQFLTKEIRFSLPALRRASSLEELDTNSAAEDAELLPATTQAHSQRSNSFSYYGLGAIDPALYRGALGLEEEQAFPEGHLGRLWVALRYETSTEKLLVTLIKAKNLPSRAVGSVNACDPLVRLTLCPDERRTLQTRPRKKACNPFFDETFVFQVPTKQLSEHTLKLTVVDAGRAKRRQAVGHVLLPLRDHSPASLSEQRVFQLDLDKDAQETPSDRGELLVSLLYNEHLHRLAVSVIEVRRLKLREGRRECYVRVSLHQQYRTVKAKRTANALAATGAAAAAAAGASLPLEGDASDASDGAGGDGPGAAASFHECFNFRVPAARLHLTSLGFHVMQPVAGYGRDKPLGKCVLGSFMFARGKALAHWNQALASPMEQVQQWHALAE